jgi:predicted nucleotidyltransferase
MGEFNEEFEKLSAILSAEYIRIYDLFEEENNKGEDKDQSLCQSLKGALFHMSRAMGECVEAKAHLVSDLSVPDLLCKMQYEQEMKEYREKLLKTNEFSNILNDKDDDE